MPYSLSITSPVSATVSSSSASMPYSLSISLPLSATIPLSSSTVSYSTLSISPSSSTLLSPSLLPVEVEELPLEVNVVNKNSCNDKSGFLPDHDYDLPNVDRNTGKKNSTSRSKHRSQYLTEWEKRSEAQYKTYVFDGFGGRHETFSCWLYLKNNSMGCRMCEKYGKRKNSNGEIGFSQNSSFL
jgi:hypothetical protein